MVALLFGSIIIVDLRFLSESSLDCRRSAAPPGVAGVAAGLLADDADTSADTPANKFWDCRRAGAGAGADTGGGAGDGAGGGEEAPPGERIDLRFLRASSLLCRRSTGFAGDAAAAGAGATAGDAAGAAGGAAIAEAPPGERIDLRFLRASSLLCRRSTDGSPSSGDYFLGGRVGS